MTTQYEVYCYACGEVSIAEHHEYCCPKCGCETIYHTVFLTCTCGEQVYLDRFTNECPECGALYNGFGQRLADPSEWDPEDRYACFGPQN